MTKKQQHELERDKKLFDFMSITHPYKRPKSQWQKSNKDKILSISDPHEQYSSFAVMDECEKNQKDAHMVMVPGDIGDYYSKSRFKKTKHVSFKEELRAVFFRLEWLSTHWQDVRIMIGNHDNRPEKQIGNLFVDSPDLLIMTEQNLLKYLACYFDNIEIVGHQIDHCEVNLTHVYQLGDIIFTHGELSAMQESAVLEKISRHLFQWRDVYKLKPYSVIAQGHNHTAAKIYRGHETWFSLPTAANPYGDGFEYIYSSRMIGKPPQVGYTIFYQSNGQTDTNNSNNFLVKR